MQNTSVLLLAQMINIGVPILMLPYLAYTLGLEMFGFVSFGMAILHIATIITDFGFPLSGTFEVVNENNKSVIRRKLYSVYVCKLMLFIVVALACVGWIFYNAKTFNEYQFYCILIVALLGNSFQPVWFFRSIERSHLIILFLLPAKLIYLAMVLLLVSEPNDYLWVLCSLAVSSILSASICFMILLAIGYQPIAVGLRDIKESFARSYGFFKSRFIMSCCGAGGSVLLGISDNFSHVAYYSSAEQIYKGVKLVFNPIANSFMTYMIKYRDNRFYLKGLVLMGVGLLCFLSFIVIFGEEFYVVVFGESFRAGHTVFLVFSVAICLAVPSIAIGYPLLGANGYNKSVNNSVTYSGVLCLGWLAFLFLSDSLTAVSAAVTVLLLESMIFGTRMLLVFKIGILGPGK